MSAVKRRVVLIRLVGLISAEMVADGEALVPALRDELGEGVGAVGGFGDRRSRSGVAGKAWKGDANIS